MFPTTVYFRDNFWSSGKTEIINEKERSIGKLNLKSMFNEGIQVFDDKGRMAAGGKFRRFSNKWHVHGAAEEQELGVLRARFAFFSKKMEYGKGTGEIYSITSPLFSNEYEIKDSSERLVAKFHRTSGIFSAPAFELRNDSKIPTEEWIAVVMGVSGIQKRNNNAGSA